MTAAVHERAAAAACRQSAAESFERCDTDGFLSQWASGITAQMHDLQAEIEEAGGLGEFVGLYMGNQRVPAKLVGFKSQYTCQWESQWVLSAAAAAKVGRKWIPFGPKSRVQKRLGLCERKEMAPAVAFIDGHGTGLSGRAWGSIRRTGNEWGMDAVLTEEK